MDNEPSVIYGLEFQARALAPKLAETEKIHFLVGTQSLKQSTNQIRLIEYNEEDSTLKGVVYNYTDGEIWKLNTSPSDVKKLVTCYNLVSSDNTCQQKTALYELPDDENPDTISSLNSLCTFDTQNLGSEIRTTEFHPNDENTISTVTDTHVIVFDLSADVRKTQTLQLQGKNSPKFTCGKWNPHQNGNQFTTATDMHLKTFDIRSGDIAWTIDNMHNQLIRDLDYNLNKQYHIATCGDDGMIKIWDFRQPTQAVYSRSDHSHWVWSVRFNPSHDQLLLSASSDARVLVSCAASVSSENNADVCVRDDAETKQMLSDGPLQWCEHEDSVYCAEWSPAEPWIFASLSYDGRLLISKVKKSLKYQIML